MPYASCSIRNPAVKRQINIPVILTRGSSHGTINIINKPSSGLAVNKGYSKGKQALSDIRSMAGGGKQNIQRRDPRVAEASMR